MASKATMVGGVIINATTFVGESYLEKYEEIKRHDLAVFLTKIVGALATGLAASQFSSKSTELLRRLPEVASALNREETRFACWCNQRRLLVQKPSSTYSVLIQTVGSKEKRINYSKKMRYLYAIVDLEGGERRATDPIYSLKVYNIEKSIASFSL